MGANSHTVKNLNVTLRKRKISHRTVTNQRQVPGYELNGEPYTF
jgi:hypothetical protein